MFDEIPASHRPRRKSFKAACEQAKASPGKLIVYRHGVRTNNGYYVPARKHGCQAQTERREDGTYTIYIQALSE